MWRGTAPIAERTVSSLMPCSRSRSTIRARVRADVMPMPPNFSPMAVIESCSRGQPASNARHFGVMSKVDLKRSHRHTTVLHGVEIGALARIGSGARTADPVAGFAARRLRLDHRLGLVPLAKPCQAIAIELALRDVGNVDIEQPRAKRLAPVPVQQVDDHLRCGLEVFANFTGQGHGDGWNAEQIAFGRGGNGAGV